MIDYRAEIVHSWVRSAPSARDLAALLGLSAPVTLREIVDRLRQVETVEVDIPINTSDGSALNGRAAFLLRSDGSYVFSGHMRATGLPSYHFGVQAWASGSGGLVVAAQERGRVFGTDTPGDRQRNWSQAGVNPGIAQHWRALRGGPGIGYHLQAEISGVLGGAVDVLTFAVKGIAANLALGPYGWMVLVGNELAGLDSRIGSPNVLAGIVAAGGTLLIVGPFGLVPAIVAGVVAASIADVKHRPMKQAERDFADRVFGGRIDYDNVVITNMTRDGGRRFATPSIGNTILVNMGDGASFDTPTTYKDASYPDPGSLFIHELTHAWQISHNSIVDLVCGLSETYEYHQGSDRLADTAWQSRRWSGFNNEQQAHIVDDWYGAHRADLNAPAALNDPAFRFIRDHIRAGVN